MLNGSGSLFFSVDHRTFKNDEFDDAGAELIRSKTKFLFRVNYVWKHKLKIFWVFFNSVQSVDDAVDICVDEEIWTNYNHAVVKPDAV